MSVLSRILIALIALSGQVSAAATSITCSPGQDINACITQVAGSGGGTVHLRPGTYAQSRTVLLKNNVNLAGTGPETIITWRDTVRSTINAPLFYSSDVSNISIENVKIVGTINQNPESQDLRNNHIGIFLDCAGDPTAGEHTGCNNILLRKIEVENSSDGIHIKGASHVTAIDLKLHNNGNTEKDYFHNVYFRRVADLRVIQSGEDGAGFYDSPRGDGIRGSHLTNVYMGNLDVHGNADDGLNFDTVYNVRLHNLDVKHNCRSGKAGCMAIKCYGPQCQINYHAPAE